MLRSLLWIYSFLSIFTMIRSRETSTVNSSTPKSSIRLKEELAMKYSKLLKALISINEERLDTMQKLHRLQEMPVKVLRTNDRQVYAVWKLDKKPAWLEVLLGAQNFRDDSSRTVDDRIDIIQTVESSDDSSSLEVWKPSKEDTLNDSDDEEDLDENKIRNDAKVDVGKNLIILPFIDPLSGSLKIWKGSKEVVSEDGLKENARRYKYAKSCSKKAAKYCKSACREAFKNLCGSFKCTSQVKRYYRKQCGLMCVDEFVNRNGYFSC